MGSEWYFQISKYSLTTWLISCSGTLTGTGIGSTGFYLYPFLSFSLKTRGTFASLRFWLLEDTHWSHSEIIANTHWDGYNEKAWLCSVSLTMWSDCAHTPASGNGRRMKITLKNSSALSLKVKHILTKWSSHCTLRYLPNIVENVHTKLVCKCSQLLCL